MRSDFSFNIIWVDCIEAFDRLVYITIIIRFYVVLFFHFFLSNLYDTRSGDITIRIKTPHW